jgi:hypothetical protein
MTTSKILCKDLAGISTATVLDEAFKITVICLHSVGLRQVCLGYSRLWKRKFVSAFKTEMQEWLVLHGNGCEYSEANVVLIALQEKCQFQGL